MTLEKKKFSTPAIFFLSLVLPALGFFLLSGAGCQPGVDTTTGSLKLLYTSEVGGRLDPCG